ncbi:MAG TPA: basic secretory protein-like protein [Vicinamibacterales bacterium]|nr:basic secretory protein-like protein [Vicinamibacterales bacterium]
MILRSACILLALLALICGSAATAQAQYFGQNKVQYEKFDFKVKKTEHFDIYYYPEEEQAVDLAARMAERWYARLSRVLRHELSSRQPIILYAAHPHFQQTNALSGEIGEGTGGVTESFKRRVILPFAGGLAETDHVLGHELVHAFQYDISSSEDAEGRPTAPGIASLPLWFIEGMAEYLSLGPVDANTAMWVRDASSREKMPTIDKLDDPDFFPYRYGHAFWAYVAGRWGDSAVGDMLRAAGPSGNIEEAITAVLGTDEETLTTDWHTETRKTYAALFETTRKPETFSRALMNEQTSGGKLNLAPSISPDGKRMVFLSERSRLSIDMFLADVASGKVIRQLTKTAADPHFDSLEFLASAGDWAPDNKRFVFSALSKGQPVLTIIDVDTSQRLLEHEFADIGEIFNPAWSPGGQQIAFSALKGGVLDLFLFDVNTRALTQLTNDPFADSDPEWSPDGKQLAWVTDRFSSDLKQLSFGNYRIGLMDVGTRQIRQLAGFGTGRNTNPEFTADGLGMFFIATPDGIPNVYRTELSSGRTARITNVLSGVSGITPLTPALSVAAAAPNVVFTVFEDDKYNIYATTDKEAGSAAATALNAQNAAVLPPVTRRQSEMDVALMLQNPAQGLPAETEYPEEDYSPKLGLDMVTQPTVGVGVDRWGAFAGGGIAFIWSDMLGNHQLGAMIQASNRIEDLGGAVMYLNRTHRWNWGLIVEQTPYTIGQFSQGVTVDPNFGTAFVQQETRITQINRGITGITQYPFSRAQRVEFSGGIRRISFDYEVESFFFGFPSGVFLGRTEEDLERPDALNLGETSAALVYDTSVFGATSPILGQRYRFEYSQTAGSLMYSGALVDYRKYFMARPFTLALRGMHYGRYGRDSEDSRISPLFIGYANLIRGYDVGSFSVDECEITATSSCAQFDRLIGSRMLVSNIELRAPLIGLFRPSAMYGGIPVEVGVFADAGVAWTAATKPSFAGGDRDWSRSVGATIRFNAFGFAVGEIDYVRPLDRPGRGWIWQFNLIPGF